MWPYTRYVDVVAWTVLLLFFLICLVLLRFVFQAIPMLLMLIGNYSCGSTFTNSIHKKNMNCVEFSFLSCPFSLWINMNVPSSVTTAKLLKYWNAFERKTFIVLDVRFQIGKYRSRNTTWYSLVTTGKSENIWRIVTTLQLPSSVDKFYYWGELRQTMRKHLLHMGISISSKKKKFPFLTR